MSWISVHLSFDLENSGILPFFSTFTSVTRRCFPALGAKGGVITVGNSSHFDDGSGKMRDAKDLIDGVK